MMPITDYTTTDEIRATLGVSATELPDSVLLQPQYGLLVNLDLEDINAGIPALYTTVSALPTNSRSTAQQRFYELTRLTAAYAIARTLLTSLPLFSVVKLTDGRAEFQRQTDIFEDVRLGVQGMYDRLRLKLSTSYVALVPGELVYTQSSFEFTSAIGIATDPVTNT